MNLIEWCVAGFIVVIGAFFIDFDGFVAIGEVVIRARMDTEKKGRWHRALKAVILGTYH
ncbi:hypothetical protein [Lacticaseibacillus mingshuiensis]|uniref:Uncharacterized protein n=1 Tax=Lacticaseibacillus mingshuiensis TaxID=2799574 RepID=A0ABW4CHT8_9LACO|nr:hypothetical protein [Lacticaseibacillus mingshuiensis]